ncbi:MAG TPA: LptF/LptG family permease, partial [Tepidisphaeraceae bacterium]|nr:LptF/LptG family permease [Tepidisphaeraceae bacterium]
MGKTLFWYIFRDLLKVFLLASGGIAGIMSFGALLRPLTQRGLDGWQVAQMLGYFLPAMTNYSWPVAALFATTFVYGRLAADNELTACRAAGISYGKLMMPGVVLGVTVCMLSLIFGWYVVPGSFLRAERVIYSNFARIRDAGSRLGDKSAGFTPSDLLAAVRKNDRSVGKGQFATGRAQMQDLADAAVSTLPNKYPDSGTTGRAMISALSAGALGGPGFYLNPLIPIAAA